MPRRTQRLQYRGAQSTRGRQATGRTLHRIQYSGAGVLN